MGDGEEYNFNDPFVLSMTINTDNSQSGNGGIFEGRSQGFTRVEIYWSGSAIVLQLGQTGDCQTNWNSCLVKSSAFAANTNQAYTVEVVWNGVEASWSVDGQVAGGPWAYAQGNGNGFGSDVPKVCYSGSGGILDWKGTISALAHSNQAPTQTHNNCSSSQTYTVFFQKMFSGKK